MSASFEPTVASLIRETFRRYNSETAMISVEGRLSSYAGLADRVWRLANALRHGLGLQQHERVAILSDNRPEYIELDFALAVAGLVKVPLYTRNAAPEHLHMLADSSARAIVIEAHFAPMLHGALDGWSDFEGRVVALDADRCEVPGTHDYESLIASASPTPVDVDVVSPDDPYQVRYTAGTTGRSKGALTSQRGMLVATNTAAFAHASECPLGPGDVIGHVVPLSHAAGFLVAGHLFAGVAQLPIPKWDPELFLKLVAEHRMSISFIVPSMIVSLLEHKETIDRSDLRSLATLAYGAAPMPEALLVRALETFGPVFMQGYGSTESPYFVTMLPKRDHVVGSPRIASMGRPAPWADIQVRDVDGRICEVDEVGEITIKGGSLLVEYINRPEATEAAFEGGHFHSGDLASRDEDGYLYFRERKSDLIISGGFNIYPAEVEGAIMRHPDVIECAVFGLADEKWGETVATLVRVKDGSSLDLSTLQAHCMQHIGSYKKPNRAMFTHEPLPVNAANKVLRRVAARMMSELPERSQS